MKKYKIELYNTGVPNFVDLDGKPQIRI